MVIKKIAESLKEKYHIVTPIIDGHGEAGETNFISIENSSKKLLNYIDANLNVRVFALAQPAFFLQNGTKVC